MATISVIIPCLNAERFVGLAIASALNQTRTPDEVLVVDNGSTDRSIEVAQGFGPAVRVFCEPRAGANAARASGAALARGEGLLFLDADDLVGPTALAALDAALDRHPGSVACCAWDRLEWREGMWIAAPASCAPRRRGQDPLSAWLTGWYHPPCSVLWSREAYEGSGGWDPRVRVNQDGDLVMRALVQGVRLVRADGGVCYYRRPLPGEVSLSGRRATPEGVESRLFVIGRIASMLRERGKLSRYGDALREAYEIVAESCRDNPELREHCLREASTSGVTAAPPPLAVRTSVTPATPVASTRPRKGPAVSVIIPTFNRAGILPRAVSSVLAQTVRDFELIVVDDGSTDGTELVVRRFADPRVRYLSQKNQGVAAARNRGLAEARGDFIAFLDSDDEWLPQKLERQLDVFTRGPSRLGLVYTGVETISSAGRSVQKPTGRGLIFPRMLHRNLIHGGGSNVLLRRVVLPFVGGFDSSLPAAEDYDLWLRISRFFEVDYAPAPLVRYYDEDAGSRLSRNFAADAAARKILHVRYRQDLRRHGVEQKFLIDSAFRQLGSPEGNGVEAARDLLRALRAAPADARTYVWAATGPPTYGPPRDCCRSDNGG
ncbi:MAG: glycosyltransferase family 2 protein [Ignavibacteriales bacterium]